MVSSLAARGPDQAQAPGDAPVSWYGLSKLEAERAAAALGERAGMRVVALRLGGVYGPRDTDLLPLFRSAARGFLPLPPVGLLVQPVHVEDVVAAVVAALSAPAPFGPWVVAEPRAYDWDEIGALMKGALGRHVVSAHVPRALFMAAARASECWASLRRAAPRFDVRRAEDLALFSYTDDVEATRLALGWAPRVALREGLAATVAWYHDVGWLS
jgi:nucleoside-diphosphate-sugar epimerase